MRNICYYGTANLIITLENLMLILIIHQNSLTINYKIYQLFKKKSSLQRYGQIIRTDKNLLWDKFNSQGKLVAQSTLAIPETTLDFEAIISHPFLNKHEYDIVVHKFSCGGNEFTKITRLTAQTVDKLAELAHLAPQEQPADVALARCLLAHYPKAKHYACFNNAFHHTLSAHNQQLLLNDSSLKNYGCHGLEFLAISQRLSQLSDKKIAKGSWIVVYLENHESTLCGIKNHKSLSCSSSYLHQNLPSLNHNGAYDSRLGRSGQQNLEQTPAALGTTITELVANETPPAQQWINCYTSAIANNVAAIANDLGGLNGIVFCGSLATSSPALRQQIIDKLAWLGCELANKANLENQVKLHKKTSPIQIFALIPEIEQAMLTQLMERL